MRFVLPTLLFCALVTAHPSDDPGQWTGGKVKGKSMYGYGGGDNANGNKIYDGGVGGGLDNSGTIGIGTGGGGGGGGSCDAVACDVKCKKEGDESGYCDTSADGGLLGLDIVGQTTGSVFLENLQS
ncbi:hypothetical protein N7513_006084 [Penicillium frequentans]|nr:hypothetical protein N7513_006084 [Penicillium glabrum]